MNCIFLRRGYGTSGDGVNYVEYIGSDGAQYIDTGFVPNQDTRVVCEFDYTTAGYVFGAEVAYKNKSFDFYTRLAVYNATAYAFTALSTGMRLCSLKVIFSIECCGALPYFSFVS